MKSSVKPKGRGPTGVSGRRSSGFGKANYLLFALALMSIAVGFWTLSRGSITLAPILLVLGYCVLVPLAIVWKGKKSGV